MKKANLFTYLKQNKLISNFNKINTLLIYRALWHIALFVGIIFAPLYLFLIPINIINALLIASSALIFKKELVSNAVAVMLNAGDIFTLLVFITYLIKRKSKDLASTIFKIGMPSKNLSKFGKILIKELSIFGLSFCFWLMLFSSIPEYFLKIFKMSNYFYSDKSLLTFINDFYILQAFITSLNLIIVFITIILLMHIHIVAKNKPKQTLILLIGVYLSLFLLLLIYKEPLFNFFLKDAVIKFLLVPPLYGFTRLLFFSDKLKKDLCLK